MSDGGDRAVMVVVWCAGDCDCAGAGDGDSDSDSDGAGDGAGAGAGDSDGDGDGDGDGDVDVDGDGGDGDGASAGTGDDIPIEHEVFIRASVHCTKMTILSSMMMRLKRCQNRNETSGPRTVRVGEHRSPVITGDSDIGQDTYMAEDAKWMSSSPSSPQHCESWFLSWLSLRCASVQRDNN